MIFDQFNSNSWRGDFFVNAAPIPLSAKRHGGDEKHADVAGPKIVAAMIN